MGAGRGRRESDARDFRSRGTDHRTQSRGHAAPGDAGCRVCLCAQDGELSFSLDFHLYLLSAVIPAASICTPPLPSSLSYSLQFRARVLLTPLVGATSCLYLHLPPSFSCRVHPGSSCPFAETASDACLSVMQPHLLAANSVRGLTKRLDFSLASSRAWCQRVLPHQIDRLLFSTLWLVISAWKTHCSSCLENTRLPRPPPSDLFQHIQIRPASFSQSYRHRSGAGTGLFLSIHSIPFLHMVNDRHPFT